MSRFFCFIQTYLWHFFMLKLFLLCIIMTWFLSVVLIFSLSFWKKLWRLISKIYIPSENEKNKILFKKSSEQSNQLSDNLSDNYWTLFSLIFLLIFSCLTKKQWDVDGFCVCLIVFPVSLRFFKKPFCRVWASWIFEEPKMTREEEKGTNERAYVLFSCLGPI